MQIGSPPPGYPVLPPPVPKPSPWPVVGAVFVGCVAVLVTVAAQSLSWLIDQTLMNSGLDQPRWQWPLTTLVNALLLIVPTVLLATLPRSATLRATGRAWLTGTIILAVLGTLRLIPVAQHELYLGALTITAVLAALALRWMTRRASRPSKDAGAVEPNAGAVERVEPTPASSPDRRWVIRMLAIAAGAVLLLPWVWLGALGGAVETVLAVTAATAIGDLAAALLDFRFWAAFGVRSDREQTHPVRTVLLSGLVAGVALLLVAAATGHAGPQLSALLVLPPTAFAIAALARQAGGIVENPGTIPLRWLVGAAALGPLAFTDPEEISLVLTSDRDVPFWTATATVASLTVAVLLGLGYALTLRTRPTRRVTAAVAAALTLIAVTAVYVGPGQPGLHGERVFVILKEQANLTGFAAAAPGQAGRDARAREVYRRLVDTAEHTQAGLRQALDRLGLSYTPYYLVNALEVSGGPAVGAWLSRRPEVDRVLVSQRLRPLPAAAGVNHGTEAAPTVPSWNLTMIGANRVWSELGVTGSGIVVGSSDSGADVEHPALTAGFRGGDDSWYDPWNGTRTPTDQGGHGTHTLSTAVGENNVGVAPGARWVGCVNLARNLGNPARYLDCLQFMLAPFPPGGDPFRDGRPERGPQVLTNSWGCPPIEGCDEGVLRPAAGALASAGVFVVAAAGNTGPYCGSVDDPPAPYSDVLSVGAVDRRRSVADFSSRGPTADGAAKPDVVAPGVEVIAAMPGGGYASLDGTSMAAPHVAGVVALMWSANPALIGDLPATWRILLETSTPALSTGGCGEEANLQGAGVVNAYDAVRAAKEARTH